MKPCYVCGRMTNLLPQRKSIRNFRPDDSEGKRYFVQCAGILDQFFLIQAHQDLAEHSARIGGGMKAAQAMRMRGCIMR